MANQLPGSFDGQAWQDFVDNPVLRIASDLAVGGPARFDLHQLSETLSQEDRRPSSYLYFTRKLVANTEKHGIALAFHGAAGATTCNAIATLSKAAHRARPQIPTLRVGGR